MIEIAETNQNTEINSDRMRKIESIVRAWAKIEADDSLTEDQKNLVTRTVMSQIWKIVEGKE